VVEHHHCAKNYDTLPLLAYAGKYENLPADLLLCLTTHLLKRNFEVPQEELFR
jgi:hypothetical protein